jgi:undecaprenyl-diphosphatase
MSNSHFILLVVQGITEFFPISSTAHLHICSKLIEHSLTLPEEMALDLIPGLIFLVYFRSDVLKLLSGFFEVCSHIIRSTRTYFSAQAKKVVAGTQSTNAAGTQSTNVASINAAPHNMLNDSPNVTFFKFILWSALPILICGALVSIFQVSIPNSAKIIGVNSIIFGALLGLSEYIHPLRRFNRGIILGLAQALACIPGVSRLGICLTVTRAMDIPRDEATRISFLCGIPAIVCAGIVGVVRARHAICTSSMGGAAIVMVALGASALCIFLQYVRTHTLLVFAVYRVCLGGVLLLL